jgi:hypothetical protein
MEMLSKDNTPLSNPMVQSAQLLTPLMDSTDLTPLLTVKLQPSLLQLLLQSLMLHRHHSLLLLQLQSLMLLLQLQSLMLLLQQPLALLLNLWPMVPQLPDSCKLCKSRIINLSTLKIPCFKIGTTLLSI